MSFKYSPFSKKQLQLLTWWLPTSPYNKANGVIAEGAVRAGKTVIMGLSFVMWGMATFSGVNFALCGKTVSSARRNIVEPLSELLKMRGYKVIDRKTEGKLIVSHEGNINIFYIFGGKDESSAALIQGLTLAGVLFDEVALMPRSFVEQAIARCSVEGAKYWFNCNPEGPRHWFKVEHVDKAKERKYVKLHFNLEDNPSLSAETIEKYHVMFTGIFYRRFILGEWAFADGVIYSSIPESTFYSNDQRAKVLPIKVQEKDVHPFYAADYGTTNPMVYLEMYKYSKPGDSIPYFYIDREYCWNSAERFRQKTDAEYVSDFKDFLTDPRYKFLIVDPSADSLYVAHQQAGTRIMKAKNDVRPGISMVSTLFSIGHIFINKDECPNLVAELGLYQWDAKKGEKGIEEPIKQNDHSCDAMRYGIFTTTSKYEVFGRV